MVQSALQLFVMLTKFALITFRNNYMKFASFIAFNKRLGVYSDDFLAIEKLDVMCVCAFDTRREAISEYCIMITRIWGYHNRAQVLQATRM